MTASSANPVRSVGFKGSSKRGLQKGTESLNLIAQGGGPVAKDNEVGDDVTPPITPAQFRDWGYHGPRQYRVRQVALNKGINYSLMMREAQRTPPRSAAERGDDPPRTKLEGGDGRCRTAER